MVDITHCNSPFHWRLLDKLALNTLNEVVLPIYPKAPEYHLEDTYQAIKKYTMN